MGNPIKLFKIKFVKCVGNHDYDGRYITRKYRDEVQWRFTCDPCAPPLYFTLDDILDLHHSMYSNGDNNKASVYQVEPVSFSNETCCCKCCCKQQPTVYYSERWF